jgi:UTP--glucose-1-phosphate uridylyltransferase
MVSKAVIPIAGKGTRLMPVASVLPKALFPLVQGDKVKAVLQVILDQVAQARISQIALVVSPGQAEVVSRYLAAAALDGKGGVQGTVTYIEQKVALGFGDAVLAARDFVGGEPFALLLGDHLHVASPGDPPCLAQVVDAFDRTGPAAMIGVQDVGPEELSYVGVTRGQHLAGAVYRCTDFVEKPDPDTARGRLRTEGLAPDRFLAHCGIYVFGPRIFECLLEEQAAKRTRGREVELAGAQSILLRRSPQEYLLCRINGRAYDMGTPAGYARTWQALAREEKQEVRSKK